MNQTLDSPLMSTASNPFSRSMVTLSLCFLLLFSSYNSAQNMVSQIYQQEGYSSLGNYSLFTVYLSFAFFCIFSPVTLTCSPLKRTLCLSVWGYLMFLLSGVFVCTCEQHSLFFCSASYLYPINLTGSLICGYSASFIWIGATAYINAACQTESQKAFYFGLFGSCSLGSQLFGNLFTVLILQYFTHLIYFVVLSSLCVLAALLMLTIKPIQLPQEDKNKKTIKETLQNVKQQYKDPKIKYLQLHYVQAGYVIGIYTAFMTSFIKQTYPIDLSDQQVNVRTAILYMILGGVQVVVGLSLKKTMNMMTSWSFLLGVQIIGVSMVVVLALGYYTLNYYVCCAAVTLIGIYELSALNAINLIIGNHFPQEHQVHQFGIAWLLKSLGVVVGIAMQLVLNDYSAYYYLAVTFSFYLLGGTSVSVFALRQK